jgi:hypothetical protein
VPAEGPIRRDVRRNLADLACGERHQEGLGDVGNCSMGLQRSSPHITDGLGRFNTNSAAREFLAESGRLAVFSEVAKGTLESV